MTINARQCPPKVSISALSSILFNHMRMELHLLFNLVRGAEPNCYEDSQTNQWGRGVRAQSYSVRCRRLLKVTTGSTTAWGGCGGWRSRTEGHPDLHKV